MADKDFKVKQGLDLGTPLPISEGGTGQTTATNAINALLPTQVDQSGKYLTTDGTNTSWALVSVSAATPTALGTVYGLTGGTNTAIGYLTLDNNTTGSDNTAIGFSASRYNISGSDNVAVGNDALLWNETGSYNTAVGSNALGQYGGVNNYNVAVGYNAGWDSQGVVNSVFIGANAGHNVTTGDDNIFVGYAAGYLVTTGSNNVIIGKDMYSGTSYTSSNEIILGNTLNNRFMIPGMGIDWTANIEMLTLAGAL